MITLVTGLMPLARRAHDRGVPMARYLWRGTDPAVTTVVLSSAAGLLGGLIAAAGLSAREATGRPVVDSLASGPIALVLLTTSVALLHANRELLTGRGVPPQMLERMRRLVSGRPGLVGASWRAVTYVYLNPVAGKRERRRDTATKAHTAVAP